MDYIKTLEKAIIEGLTNLHNDLDTLFKIVDAIVETSTITIPSGSHQINLGGINRITYDTKYNVK